MKIVVCTVDENISSPLTRSRKARGKLTRSVYPLISPPSAVVAVAVRVNREGVVFIKKKEESIKARDAPKSEAAIDVLACGFKAVAGLSAPIIGLSFTEAVGG